MITKLSIKNLKAHRDTTLSLAQFTVLVGPNGSGKTTVLDALSYIARFAGDKPNDDLFTGERDLSLIRRSEEVGPMDLEIGGIIDGTDFAAHISCDLDSQYPRGWKSLLSWTFGSEHLQPAAQKTFSEVFHAHGPKTGERWQKHVSNLALFRLNARVIAAPASSRQPMPDVKFDGRDVAAAIKAIKLGHDDIWKSIVDTLRQIVPNVRSLGVELVPAPAPDPAPSASSSLADPSGEWYRLIFDFEGAPRVPAPHASEGTLLALALVTILLGPAAPRIVLLDDIEQGLHPAAQMQLVQSITKLLALDSMRGTQIVATTHSPYILEHLDFDQVRVFAIGPDGGSAVKSLASHPDAERVRGAMSAGELWTSDQEAKWVVEK